MSILSAREISQNTSYKNKIAKSIMATNYQQMSCIHNYERMDDIIPKSPAPRSKPKHALTYRTNRNKRRQNFMRARRYIDAGHSKLRIEGKRNAPRRYTPSNHPKGCDPVAEIHLNLKKKTINNFPLGKSRTFVNGQLPPPCTKNIISY